MYYLIEYVIRPDCHIIIGTPKEIIAYRLLNIFDVNNLVVAVIDDSDMVATFPLMKSNIIDPLPKSCQKIYVSSVQTRSNNDIHPAIELKLTINDSFYPQTITDYFIKLPTNSNKLEIISAVCSEVFLLTRAQAIIFFTVSSAFYI